jgi:hypothetical protein
MKFKSGMFIDEKTLTKSEAEEFYRFLLDEIERHKEHMNKYQQIARDDAQSSFMRIVALTVVQRNLEDIEHTNRTLAILDKILEE